MKQFVFAVYDSAVLMYSRPFFTVAIGAAVRSFTDEVNRRADDNPMHAHPDDYALFVLGTFDEESGMFSQTEDEPRCLARAKDVLTQMQ